ncbi:MAG: head GIN domain-containing protein [Flavobacteriaceae bacterium]
MKKTIIQFSALFFLTILSSCGLDMLNRIEGNNNVISIDRDIDENFTKVRVSTGIELIIDQGSEVSLTVEADENLHDIIITEVEDGKLKIYTEKNIWKSASKKVYLTVNTLEELKASSGSSIKTSNVLNATNLTIGSSSGASVNLDIKADNLNSKTSSGASANLDVNATNVVSDSSSGSTMKIKGEASTHETNASSGSSINAYRLVSKNVTAKVSSGASISVYASENINGRASSGGSISFEGDPKTVTKNTSSGGSISSR